MLAGKPANSLEHVFGARAGEPTEDSLLHMQVFWQYLDRFRPIKLCAVIETEALLKDGTMRLYPNWYSMVKRQGQKPGVARSLGRGCHSP